MTSDLMEDTVKTPVNARTLRQHITYSWWKYLLLIILSVGAVLIYYDVSEYKAPPEKKVDVFVYGLMDEDGFRAYLENVRVSEMEDMEEIIPRLLVDDSQYGPMQLVTYIAAGEGDVFLLPREQFLSMAADGVWLSLEDDQDLMALFDSAEVNLQSGWRKNTETGETHLVGIPLSKLPGFDRYVYVNNGYLCVGMTSPNLENAVKLLKILCRDMLTPPVMPEETALPEGA